MKTKGIIASVRKDKHGFKIGDFWFSDRINVVDVNRGDEVEVEYVENGQWKNIISVEKLSSGSVPAPRQETSSKDFRLNVDAGNILQREVDLLAGLKLDLAVTTKVLTEGTLGGFLTEEFVRIRTKLSELDKQEEAKEAQKE